MAEESAGDERRRTRSRRCRATVGGCCTTYRGPAGRRSSIEHVVVGPAGVFVVDTKNWAGTVSVRAGVLRLDKYSRQGAVTHVAEAARAISAQLRTARCPVRPVLCLVRDEPISADCDGVLVCSTANVVERAAVAAAGAGRRAVQRLARDLAGPALPLAPAATSTGSWTRRAEGWPTSWAPWPRCWSRSRWSPAPEVVRDAVEGAVVMGRGPRPT